jgi:hypothetical protein
LRRCEAKMAPKRKSVRAKAAPDAITVALVAQMAGTREIKEGPQKELAEIDLRLRLPSFEMMTLALSVFGEFAREEEPATEMLAHVPAWLELAPRERKRAAEMLLRVLREYPVRSWWELLWCLAVDATRPRKRGRKSIWLGPDGIRLIMDVERKSQERGLKRTGRKGLSGFNGIAEKGVIRAIVILQKEAPQRYGKFSNAALRAGYYDAWAYNERVWKAAQSGNSANKPTRL